MSILTNRELALPIAIVLVALVTLLFVNKGRGIEATTESTVARDLLATAVSNSRTAHSIRILSKTEVSGDVTDYQETVVIPSLGKEYVRDLTSGVEYYLEGGNTFIRQNEEDTWTQTPKHGIAATFGDNQTLAPLFSELHKFDFGLIVELAGPELNPDGATLDLYGRILIPTDEQGAHVRVTIERDTFWIVAMIFTSREAIVHHSYTPLGESPAIPHP